MDKDPAKGRALQAFMEKLGLGRVEFSHRYGIPMGTLDKWCAGDFTDKALVRLKRITGWSPGDNTSFEQAAKDLGGYLYARNRHIEGNYTLIRPSFWPENRICLYPLMVDWDENRPGFRLSSLTEKGYRKFAHMAFPEKSPFLFVHANDEGWMTLMIFGTMDGGDAMPGALLTTGRIGPSAYTPFFVPVLLRKEKGTPRQFQELSYSDPGFSNLKEKLNDVDLRQFVRSPMA